MNNIKKTISLMLVISIWSIVDASTVQQKASQLKTAVSQMTPEQKAAYQKMSASEKVVYMKMTPAQKSQAKNAKEKSVAAKATAEKEAAQKKAAAGKKKSQDKTVAEKKQKEDEKKVNEAEKKCKILFYDAETKALIGIMTDLKEVPQDNSTRQGGSPQQVKGVLVKNKGLAVYLDGICRHPEDEHGKNPSKKGVCEGKWYYHYCPSKKSEDKKST